MPFSDLPEEGARPDPVPVPRPRQPVFNDLPGVVLALAIVILGVQALDSLFPGAHAWAYQLGAVVTGPLRAELPQPFNGVLSLILHVFVHAGWLHALMNLFILLAAGNAAARPFGPGLKGQLGFLLFFFVCAATGAALQIAVLWNASGLMVGASTGVSGLIAAAGWARGGRAGMLQLAVPWLVINIGLALFDLVAASPISWAGHIGGLAAGAVLYPLFVQVFGPRRTI